MSAPEVASDRANVVFGIGSRVWKFDLNRRRYTERTPGSLSSTLIYRGHFVEHEIVGETKVSWIVGFRVGKPDNIGGGRICEVGKLPKKGPPSAWKSLNFYTDVEMEDVVFVHDHAFSIAERVRRCDSATLRKVAELIGYEVTE